MRRTLITSTFCALVVTAVLLGSARPANATEVGYGRKFGIGFMLGDPTGLTAKLWTGPTNSIDFGLGFWGYGFNDCAANRGACNYYGYHHAAFHADYLWQSNIVRGQAQLDWHIGAGGRGVFFSGCPGDCFALAARMPVGLDLMFNNPSFIEVFFELAPTLYLVPWADFGIEGAIGVRFYP
jgi:hypothetical protein